MDVLQPCAGVDPGYGPHWLPDFKWRVLYEVADLTEGQRATGTPQPCVMERQLLFSVADVLDLGLKAQEVPADDFVTAVNAAARKQLRDAVTELAQRHCVMPPDGGTDESREWCIQLTGAGYNCVREWRHRWIAELESRAAQPSWWRAWVSGLVAPPQAAVILTGTITLIGGFLLGHFIHG